jgi:hypothetical protein
MEMPQLIVMQQALPRCYGNVTNSLLRNRTVALLWKCYRVHRSCHQGNPTCNNTIQKNTTSLLDASKEVGLEVNPEKTKYMLVSRCRKTGQRQSIKIVNRSFESVAKFKYLEITLIVKDQNCIHEEIKSRLISGNACYR